MEESIKEKLRNALSESITKECQVVYIMVEIRKLLDRTKSKYPLLRFYCNWALHIEINKISGAREILEKMAEKRYSLEGMHFIDFSHLYKELESFLSTNGLTAEFMGDYRKWFNFKKLLVEVLIDCPIKIQPEPIEEFVFKKPKNNNKDVDWEIKFPNDPKRHHGSLSEDVSALYD